MHKYIYIYFLIGADICCMIIPPWKNKTSQGSLKALMTFLAAIKGYKFQTDSLITLISIISKRVKSTDSEVEHTGQVERDASPKREVPGEPEESLIFCAKENGKKV